jgi:chemotaxis protein MotD
MITDILGSKTPNTDPAISAKQANIGQKDSGGFSSALSGFGNEAHKGNSATAAEDAANGVSAEDAPQAEAQPTKPKPIIDIRPEFVRQKPTNVVADALEVIQKQGEVTKEGKLSPAERKLREALLNAKEAARKSEELERGKSPKGETDADASISQEPDATILMADDAKVADMLSMLSGGAANFAEIGTLIQKHGSAFSKRAGDTEEQLGSSDLMPEVGLKRGGSDGHALGDPLAMPTDAEAPDAASRTFRFTNARNENHRIDMSVIGGGAERSVEFRSSSSGGAETVTVLDSRRFLGLAPNSNSANLTALISGDSEWSAAMQPSSSLSNAAAQSGTGTVVNMLKLQMNPHDLGHVTATLRLHGEELNVHLTVETRAAYRQLSEDSGGIVDALRAQGFAVDQVTISISPTADSDGAAGRQDQPGQSGQQSAADGGRQNFSAGRGQEQAEARQRTVQGAGTAGDVVSEQSHNTGSGSGRPDQLYL